MMKATVVAAMCFLVSTAIYELWYVSRVVATADYVKASALYALANCAVAACLYLTYTLGVAP